MTSLTAEEVRESRNVIETGQLQEAFLNMTVSTSETRVVNALLQPLKTLINLQNATDVYTVANNYF